MELLTETIDLFDEYYKQKKIQPLTEKQAQYVSQMEKNGEINEAVKVFRRAFHLVWKDYTGEGKGKKQPPVKKGNLKGFHNFDNNVYTLSRHKSLDVEHEDEDDPAYVSRFEASPQFYFEATSCYLRKVEYEFLSFINWKNVHKETLMWYFCQAVDVKSEAVLRQRTVYTKKDTERQERIWEVYATFVSFVKIYANEELLQIPERDVAIVVADFFFKEKSVLKTPTKFSTSKMYTEDNKRNSVAQLFVQTWRSEYSQFCKEHCGALECKFKQEEAEELETYGRKRVKY